MNTQKKKGGLKKILLGLFILIVIGVGVTWYIFTEKFTDTSERKADFSVKAVDFLKEFQQNDSGANKKYIEKIVSVKGTVSEIIEAAGDSTANIKMTDTSTGNYIIFTFQQQHIADTKKIKQGDEVSIKASCSGGTYSEILDTRYVSFKRAALDK